MFYQANFIVFQWVSQNTVMRFQVDMYFSNVIYPFMLVNLSLYHFTFNRKPQVNQTFFFPEQLWKFVIPLPTNYLPAQKAKSCHVFEKLVSTETESLSKQRG